MAESLSRIVENTIAQLRLALDWCTESELSSRVKARGEQEGGKDELNKLNAPDLGNLEVSPVYPRFIG